MEMDKNSVANRESILPSPINGDQFNSLGRPSSASSLHPRHHHRMSSQTQHRFKRFSSQSVVPTAFQKSNTTKFQANNDEFIKVELHNQRHEGGCKSVSPSRNAQLETQDTTKEEQARQVNHDMNIIHAGFLQKSH